MLSNIITGIIMFVIRHIKIHRIECWEYTHSYVELDGTRMLLTVIHINYGENFVEVIFQVINTRTNILQVYLKEYDRNEFFNLLGEEYANI